MKTVEEFVLDIKNKSGDQVTRDGRLLRDIPDRELLKKVLDRYPGERENIIDLDAYLDEEELKPTAPKSDVQERLDTAKKGFFGNLKQKFGERAEKGAEALVTEQGKGSKALQVAGQAAGFLTDIATEGVKAVTPDFVERGLEKGSEFIAGTDYAQDVAERYGTWKEQNPEQARNLEATVNIASILPVGKAAQVTGQLGKKAGSEIVETATQKMGERAARLGAETAQSERDIIQGLIAPGLNKKEVQRAMEEGRITRGEEGFWLGKKPDIVEVDQKIKEVTDTIQRRIPDASKLDDVGLSIRTKREIENIATDLEPKMKEVRLRDVTPSETPIAKIAKQYKTEDEFVNAFARGEFDVDTLERITKQYGDDIFDDTEQLRSLYKRAQTPSMIEEAFGAWENVKKRQAREPEFLDFPSNKAFQEKFENYLNQMRKGTEEKTLSDLWKIRKDYDASIPAGIKQANDMSPIQRQVQKEMWLENRRILNDLINDSSRGLGDESRQAFKDMSDLYTARENIIGKTKLDTKGEPGFIQKTGEFIKGGAQNAVPFGAGALIF